MKKLILLLTLLYNFASLNAQTWNGSVDTNWNTAANWTGGVPAPSGNVTIPAALPNYPRLQAATTINSINMAVGSALDVNGFVLTVTNTSPNYNYYRGTVSNSSATTDIVINHNTGTAGYLTYIQSCTFTDNLTFNITGSNQFNEADAGTSNTYTGNTTFNVNDPIPFFFSHAAKSTINGNLTIARPGGGFTQAFNAGCSIGGNLTITNPGGNQLLLGNTALRTTIGGTINITHTATVTSHKFQMYRLINQVTGGTININTPGEWNIQNDTLLVTALTLNGLLSNYFYLYNSKITGNITTTDNPSNGSGFQSYIRNNEFIGTTIFTSNSNGNQFNEAAVANSANIYNGNATFNANGSATMLISHGSRSIFNGNVTINKSNMGARGTIYFGNTGATVSGNFAYTNPLGGALFLGNLANRIAIGGTLSINHTDPAYADVQLHRLINQVNGGNIAINSLGDWNVQADTIKVGSMSLSGLKSRYFYLYNNKILGNITTADDPTNASGYQTNIRNNEITGTSIFTHNSNNNQFNEADTAVPSSSNTFIGNVTFNLNGGGQVILSHGSRSTYTGNVTINKGNMGARGTIYFGNAGANVSGNFSYSNPLGGALYLGNLASRTAIGGTLAVAHTDPQYADIQLHRLVNQVNGGNISINSLGDWSIRGDTIKVGSMSLSGLKSRYFYLYNNKILGNVSSIDDPTNGGGYQTYIRNNEITGSTSFTNLSNGNQFNEAEAANSANTFIGNVIFNMHGSGLALLSHGSRSTYNGNVTINKTGTAGTIYFGSAGANITGNLGYSNLLGGNLYLGNLANATHIGGTLNIAHSHTGYSDFQLHRFINQTTGGTIAVNTIGEWSVQGDTIRVANMSLNGLTSRYFYLFNNKITGNFSSADNPLNGGGYNSQIRNNEIIGNTTFTNNGSNILFDANAANQGNKYVGNVTYNKIGSGAIQIALSDTNTVHGNMTINSTAGISLGLFEFAGATNSTLEQTGSQAVNLASIRMNKVGAATLTLADPITLAQNLTLVNGIINNTSTTALNMLSGSATTGAKNSSHVNGFVSKAGTTAFTFPVGGGGFYAPIAITAPSNNSTFLAKYNRANVPILTPLGSGLDHLLSSEYWDLTRTAGTGTAKVTLNYDALRTYYCINSLPDLRVANYHTSIWNNEGTGGTTPPANVEAFDIVSANTISTFGQFVMGSSTTLNPFVDTIKPTITAPANINLALTTGCTVTVSNLGTPITADNCKVATVTNNRVSTTYPLGVTNIIWTVTDLTGNTQTATQTVTVTDPIKPTITAPATINTVTNTACTATGVTLGTPITADNCTVASVTNNAPAAFPLGTTLVLWTVTDNSGNTATALQTVNVTDNIKPTITAPANISVNIVSGCTATVATLGTPSTADNCSVASVTNNSTSTTYNLGVNQIIWTVTDGSGNTQTAIQTVTVIDNIKPNIEIATANLNITAFTNTGCTATGVIFGTPSVISDNCGIANLTNNAPFAFPIGLTTITWTITDTSGNTKTATQNVTVIDNVKPSITAPANVTVNISSGCTATVPSLGTPITGDNCAVASVVNNSASSSYPVGVTNVLWTVTDANGNTQTASQTVTITNTASAMFTIVSSGAWTSPSTWSGCRLPTNSETVTIKANHIINIPNTNIGLNAIKVKNIIVETNGRINNSGELRINTP